VEAEGAYFLALPLLLPPKYCRFWRFRFPFRITDNNNNKNNNNKNNNKNYPRFIMV
jgi:hypothetical protein